MKRIILTGGGTAGHVTPNIALMPALEKKGFDIRYIGSKNGMEREMIRAVHVPYYGISSGKLRRYFDVKNFTDPFRVLKGYLEARSIMKKLKPDIVFSKGGFVTVPVVMAAKHCGIPVIIHESDMTPGLANKLALPSASKVCCNFPETLNHLPEEKAVLTGSPIRKELFEGNREKGLRFCGFTSDKPVLLIMGGSLGSVAINTAVRKELDVLLETFQIAHLCGKGNLDPSLDNKKGYAQFEFVSDELNDIFACTDLMVSRAGANAICEILALRKPNVLIPLSAKASRGDQILNAASFEKQGYSYVLQEEDVTNETLLKAIRTVYEQKDTYINSMEKSKLSDPIAAIMDLIDELTA
ncbi:MAG TPA: undecaprenyldiphospho-muramoylpentapeptide beta-N-acetylglucosaminyltransferase [Candidatus Fimousia stercorigallinarum]|nr:undecaprenyldiphospho-muramoylpentapeptide beta-N-acetylglucosaminyltransferase [Candidatus Fimousia stercorigallinarum]